MLEYSKRVNKMSSDFFIYIHFMIMHGKEKDQILTFE